MSANGNGDSLASSDQVPTLPFSIGGRDYHDFKETFDLVSPATGKLLYRCGSASVDDADAAIEAAAKAFPAWKKTALSTRRDIFLKAARIWEDRKDELFEVMMADTGATKGWAGINWGLGHGILLDAAVRVMALDGSFPATKDVNTSCIVTKEPYGVVLSIAPWLVAACLFTLFQTYELTPE